MAVNSLFSKIKFKKICQLDAPKLFLLKYVDAIAVSMDVGSKGQSSHAISLLESDC